MAETSFTKERHDLFYDKLWEYRCKLNRNIFLHIIDAFIPMGFIGFLADCEEYMMIRSTIDGDYSGPYSVIYENGIAHDLKFANKIGKVFYLKLKNYLIEQFPELLSY